MNIVEKAELFAREKHKGQTRKGAAQENFVNHLEEVVQVLMDCGVDDPAVLAAAWLHDTIEDAHVPYEKLQDFFGTEIADIVQEVSDNINLSKEDRKRKQVESAPLKSPKAKLIKIADKISNLKSVIASPPIDWNLERKCEYFIWSNMVVSGCRGGNPNLEAKFDDVYLDGLDRLNPPPDVLQGVFANPYKAAAKDGFKP